MKNTLTILCLVLVLCSAAVAQFSLIGETNAYLIKNKPGVPDSLKPWFSDQGVRRVWVGSDLDKDGKQELIATDYSYGGKVHVFEMTAPGQLELVWSSPARASTVSSGSTPRCPRVGDLDGDGDKEIIFTLSTGAADYEVEVWEYNGTDNGYGDPVTHTPSMVLPAAQFSALGIGAFRTNREAMDVADYDNDGRDELIMANRDQKVYVLGIQGEYPGFGSWQVEGGDPANTPENGFIGPSWWHSIAADIDGDGKKEIVNHYYDFYGFWSIDPIGPDTYRYPRPVADGKTTHVFQYTKSWAYDACSYMGIHAADVDGDGKDEIAGILYGPGTYDYSVVLNSLTRQDTGVYVWKDSTQFAIIGDKLWELAGKTSGSHWGMDTYDFDGDGKDEIYVGGSADYNVIQMKYKGSGSVLDKGSYTNTVVYPGDKARYHELTYYDSLGHPKDTLYAESPFLSGIFAGGDIDGDGKKELAIAYQSIADSITHHWYHWDTTGLVKLYTLDSTRKTLNTNVINVRILEYQGATGFKEEHYSFIGPEDYILDQNYPNPFNPSTAIRFTLPVDNKVTLVVYDLLGQEVKTLVRSEALQKGAHQVAWDGTNNSGNPVASGTYVYTLKHDNFSTSQKMLLVR